MTVATVKVRRVTLIGLAGVSLISGIGIGVSVPHSPQMSDFKSCTHEDDRDCFWDATRDGDSTGWSFIDVDGVAWYRADSGVSQ